MLKTFILFSVLCLGAAAFSAENAELVFESMTDYPVTNVTLVNQEIVEEKTGPFINRKARITLGVTTLAHQCTKSFELKVVSAQASLSDALNPTDLYLRVVPKESDCGAVAGMGSERNLEVQHSIHLDQRLAGEPAGPLPDLEYGRIYHLNFDIGMLGGFNRWGMYRLDLSDLAEITLSHVKNYTYVQGSAKDL